MSAKALPATTVAPYAWAVEFGRGLHALFNDQARAEHYAADSHGLLVELVRRDEAQRVIGELAALLRQEREQHAEQLARVAEAMHRATDI